ncbi:MAG: LamG domain-containing protein [Caldilineaceae bacterium]
MRRRSGQLHTLALIRSGVENKQGGGQPIIAKSDGDYRNYAIYFNPDRKIYLTRHCTEGDLIELFSEATLPLDQFTHVAATYDGAYLALYINGVLDNSEQVQSRNACHNDAPLTIGAPYNANTHYRFFNGVLDEVLVYADALGITIQDLTKPRPPIREEQARSLRGRGHLTSSLAETLPQAVNYYANADIQLEVAAADIGSNITLLESI